MFLVEGYVDALALVAIDYGAAAVGGTGMSEVQVEEAKRLPGALYVLPDADEEAARPGDRGHGSSTPRRCFARTTTKRRHKMIEKAKDAADLFAEKGEDAKGILERLKQEAQDALDSALAAAPEGSKRERYRHAKEGLFPLISLLEDPGERALPKAVAGGAEYTVGRAGGVS